MLYLKALNAADARKEYDFFQQMPNENGFINSYEQTSFAEFCTEGIPTRLLSSRGEGLKPGLVPDTYYFLWDDDTIVGLFKVRPTLNEALRSGAGHVGYGVLPSYRRRGYAAKGLALVIQLLKELPEFTDDEIYLRCNLDNAASLKTMLKNGGYIHHADTEGYYVRIKL